MAMFAGSGSESDMIYPVNEVYSNYREITNTEIERAMQVAESKYGYTPKRWDTYLNPYRIDREHQ